MVLLSFRYSRKFFEALSHRQYSTHRCTGLFIQFCSPGQPFCQLTLTLTPNTNSQPVSVRLFLGFYHCLSTPVTGFCLMCPLIIAAVILTGVSMLWRDNQQLDGIVRFWGSFIIRTVRPLFSYLGCVPMFSGWVIYDARSSGREFSFFSQ